MDAACAPTDQLSSRLESHRRTGGASGRFQLLHHGHPERESLQRFIAARYAQMYGARVEHFADHLVGLRHAGGGWDAGLGYTLPGHGRLFVEQYLDRPIEEAITSSAGVWTGRDEIVEVGNLAAVSAGTARHVIVHMTRLLHELRRTWVVFTSTRALLNSFVRLAIPTLVLAPADPGRLPDRGASWGSYYATDPRVMTANIPFGFAHLQSVPPSREHV